MKRLIHATACFCVVAIGLFLIPSIALAEPERESKPKEAQMQQIEKEHPQYLENRKKKAPFVDDRKTNIGLVNFAYKALNEKWGYVYGGKGQLMTEELVDAITNSGDKMYDSMKYREKTKAWVGQRATDCSGLIMDYFWWAGDDINPIRLLCEEIGGFNADNMLNAATIKGEIDTLPERPGTLLHRKGHVGIYIGNGEVIEAKGVEHGVVKTKLVAGKWKNWSQSPWVDYETNGIFKLDGRCVQIEDGCVASDIDKTEPVIYGNSDNIAKDD